MSFEVFSESPTSKTKKKAQPRKSSASANNISAIAAMERDATECRSMGERMGDAIANYAGRLWFIALHAVWFAVWIAWNTGALPHLRAFDPFPFEFLTFMVSLEAIFLSLFILMSQNRASKQADDRSHLDLQINLLAEQESTKMLQMLQKLCEHHNLKIASDPEVELLQKKTHPETLLQELKDSLPGSNC
jgi:uncharacterized membrane protein